MSDKMDVDPPADEQLSGASTPVPDSDAQPAVGDQDVGRDAEAPSSSSTTTHPIPDDAPALPSRPNNWARREIARTTIEIIDNGSYEVNGQAYDLQPTTEALIEGTVYYPPDSTELEEWSKTSTNEHGEKAGYDTDISIVQCSTLEGCHQLHGKLVAVEGERDRRIGVLNFASAKKPGGGFLTGAQAQEETIARSSTLYASLMINTAQQFYRLHHEGPKDGYYTHAMIYSPHVQLLRHDSGEWHPPLEVDVLTSPAVNAGDVRRKSDRRWFRGSDEDSNESEGEDAPKEDVERKIEAVMQERMGRILYLFEKRGVKNLVLGSFGTGVFQNSVEVVAKLWIELLVKENARFKRSFENIVFAIIDTPTVTMFREVFERTEGLEEWEVVSREEGTVGEAQDTRAGEDKPDGQEDGQPQS